MEIQLLFKSIAAKKMFIKRHKAQFANQTGGSQVSINFMAEDADYAIQYFTTEFSDLIYSARKLA